MSTFGWLDYSEHQRREALEVIDLFREEETRDELGLGTIRDALSDLLFPGTSTIQTRARYFLFVPWVYAELERKRVPAEEFERQLRRVQGRLRNALIEGGNESGVIGYRAGVNVQRLPSSVYWVGLRRWDVLRFDGSEADFAATVDRSRRRFATTAVPDGGDPSDRLVPAWDPHLPATPANLFETASFDLSRSESEYLIDRIVHRFPRSLLAHALLTGQVVGEDTAFAWEVEWTTALQPDVLDALRHAQNFSEAMHGAALLYNLLLAEAQPGAKLVDNYRERLSIWGDGLAHRHAALSAWDRAAFWALVAASGARVPPQTRDFVDRWLRIVLDDGRAKVSKVPAARTLVTDRERAIKRSRARLGNDRAVELWSGAAGIAQMDYRWGRPVRAILDDVLSPLRAAAKGGGRA